MMTSNYLKTQSFKDSIDSRIDDGVLSFSEKDYLIEDLLNSLNPEIPNKKEFLKNFIESIYEVAYFNGRGDGWDSHKKYIAS